MGTIPHPWAYPYKFVCSECGEVIFYTNEEPKAGDVVDPEMVVKADGDEPEEDEVIECLNCGHRPMAQKGVVPLDQVEEREFHLNEISLTKRDDTMGKIVDEVAKAKAQVGEHRLHSYLEDYLDEDCVTWEDVEKQLNEHEKEVLVGGHRHGQRAYQVGFNLLNDTDQDFLRGDALVPTSYEWNQPNTVDEILEDMMDKVETNELNLMFEENEGGEDDMLKVYKIFYVDAIEEKLVKEEEVVGSDKDEALMNAPAPEGEDVKTDAVKVASVES